MSQIMKKWIGDHQVDSTKIDPSYKYTMQGLNIPVTGTFGIGVVNPPVPEISNPGAGALRLQSTAGGGRTYELNSDVVGNFNIKDVNASANRLSITPSGVINISNAMIGQTTFSTLTVTGDTFLHDASVSENLFVGEAIGVNYDSPLSTMAINGGLEIGSNTGIPGGLLVSDAPGGTEKFQVVLGNGGLTHVTASDTGAMSLEAGMASIEIGDFGSGTISLNGSTQINNTPGIPSLQVYGDTSVSENLFVGEAIGVNYDSPLSTMAINGGLEIGSNTGIPGGLLVSDAPGGTEKFQVVLGNGGLTHVQASDTGAMSLEAGMASIEIGNFGAGTISLGGDTEIIGVLTQQIPRFRVISVWGQIGSLGDLNISPDGELYLIAGGDGIITTEGALEIGGHLNVVGAFPFWATGDATVSGLFVLWKIYL